MWPRGKEKLWRWLHIAEQGNILCLGCAVLLKTGIEGLKLLGFYSVEELGKQCVEIAFCDIFNMKISLQELFVFIIHGCTHPVMLIFPHTVLQSSQI